MPQITNSQAKEFLDDISSKEKVLIIHDDDSDGFCSAIAVYHYLKEREIKNIKSKTFRYGKSSFDEFNLNEIDKIIILDIAPKPMIEDLKKISNKKTLYIDHHQTENTKTPERIFELRTISKGYIPVSRTVYEILERDNWICLAGTIWDSADLYPENKEFLEKQLNQLNMSFEEFKEKIVDKMSSFLIYFNKDLDKAFEILKNIYKIEELKELEKYSVKVQKEIKKFIKDFENKKEKLGQVIFYYFEPKYSVKIEVVNTLSRKYSDEILIFTTPRENKISISARNNSKKKNLVEFMQKAMKDIKGTYGGHFSAAGGVINKEDFRKFKDNLSKIKI